ncbi:hypothetical protein FisN_8Lh028 [Fistulifera solaris]|uniref:Trichome birefringence-like C-terminal domain-containing protein n=1 Tax=Fistulifera solaris TaxID=1519565 RepID=A0A1Z5JDI4_FISSO|nr:hypothetical protein FisN_8Lh028 [Fistulifera solaris]|eukprot:GAX11942.1 hypothetical protein FisN_8Lh028 [Fistulifera solaris]
MTSFLFLRSLLLRNNTTTWIVRVFAVLTMLTMYYSCLFSFLQTIIVPVSQSPTTLIIKDSSDLATETNHLATSTTTALPEYDLLWRVHSTPEAAAVAGRWVNRPNQALQYSAEHLQCLDLERQGNCHDPDAWKYSNDKAKQSRHRAILKQAVANSPGILNASDPWVWESDSFPYQVLPYHVEEYKQRVRRLLHNRTIYLVGDSVTRQWAQVLRCELLHILDFTQEQAERTIQRMADFCGEELREVPTTFLQNAQPQDYLIINYGHHCGRGVKGPEWSTNYTKLMSHLQDISYGLLPDTHIFVRTTEPRHFLRGAGDWNTNSSQAGGSQPNMHAKWSLYGGNSPEQPMQNKLLLRILASEKRRRNFQILDTAPLMLARADASFDGTHFCLPGPHQLWSQMLYHRIEQE